MAKIGDVRGVDQAPDSHFFTKLAFAAPASFLPSFPTAPASQHFFMELALAAPASAFPSLPTELLPVPRTLGLGVMMGLEVADGTTEFQPRVQARGGAVGARSRRFGCAGGA